MFEISLSLIKPETTAYKLRFQHHSEKRLDISFCILVNMFPQILIVANDFLVLMVLKRKDKKQGRESSLMSTSNDGLKTRLFPNTKACGW